MKKKHLALLVFTISLLLASFTLSQARGPMAKGNGTGNCDCYNAYSDTNSKDENFKKFRQETLPLRKEINAKRFELEQEYLSENPDNAKINALKGDISNLRSKVQDVKNKYGITGKRFNNGCY